jgi:hypothetical protein
MTRTASVLASIVAETVRGTRRGFLFQLLVAAYLAQSAQARDFRKPRDSFGSCRSQRILTCSMRLVGRQNEISTRSRVGLRLLRAESNDFWACHHGHERKCLLLKERESDC